MAKGKIEGKVKRIKFKLTYFEVGLPKWEAGKHYPVNEDTQRLVKAGIAEEIEVDADSIEEPKLALEEPALEDKAKA
jgi:hypothetical protein